MSMNETPETYRVISTLFTSFEESTLKRIEADIHHQGELRWIHPILEAEYERRAEIRATIDDDDEPNTSALDDLII